MGTAPFPAWHQRRSLRHMLPGVCAARHATANDNGCQHMPARASRACLGAVSRLVRRTVLSGIYTIERSKEMRTRLLATAVALATVFAAPQAVAKTSAKAAAASKKHHKKHIHHAWADPELM